MIERMEDGAYEHCLAINTRENIFMLLKFIKEDCTDHDNELDKPRMLGQAFNLHTLPNILLYSVINSSKERCVSACPTTWNKTLFCPNVKKCAEWGVSEVVIHCSNNTIASKEWFYSFKIVIKIGTPVCHGMKFDMLCPHCLARY